MHRKPDAVGAVVARSLRVAVAALLTTALAASMARAQTELPADVRAALERNAEALDPLTIKWRREGSSELSLDALLSRLHLPDYDRAFLRPLEATYVTQDGRYFAHFDHVRVSPKGNNGRPKLSQGVQEVSFDGARRFVASPANEKRLGMVIIDPVENPVEASDALMLMANYLRMAGFAVAEKSSQSGWPPRSLLLELVEHGAKIVGVNERRVDDVECLAVDLESNGQLRRFDLDPKLHYAVRRQETRNLAGERIESVRLSDFVQMPGHADVWFPKQAVHSFHQWKSNPKPPAQEVLFRETSTVTRLETKDVPQNQFVIMYTTPGTSISDGSLPEAKESPTGRISYLVPADPADLDATIREAIASLPRPPEEPGSLRLVLILVNVLIVLALLAWMAARRWRQQPTH